MSQGPEIAIGERVRFYRDAQHKTQAVVAGLAGITVGLSLPDRARAASTAPTRSTRPCARPWPPTSPAALLGRLLLDDEGPPLERHHIPPILRRLARCARLDNPAALRPHVLRTSAAAPKHRLGQDRRPYRLVEPGRGQLLVGAVDELCGHRRRELHRRGNCDPGGAHPDASVGDC